MPDVPVDDNDPPPVAPPPVDDDACCGNGCDPCVFDLHDAARERYRVALREWQARQARRQQGGAPAQTQDRRPGPPS